MIPARIRSESLVALSRQAKGLAKMFLCDEKNHQLCYSNLEDICVFWCTIKISCQFENIFLIILIERLPFFFIQFTWNSHVCTKTETKFQNLSYIGKTTLYKKSTFFCFIYGNIVQPYRKIYSNLFRVNRYSEIHLTFVLCMIKCLKCFSDDKHI